MTAECCESIDDALSHEMCGFLCGAVRQRCRGGDGECGRRCGGDEGDERRCDGLGGADTIAAADGLGGAGRADVDGPNSPSQPSSTSSGCGGAWGLLAASRVALLRGVLAVGASVPSFAVALSHDGG